MVHKKRCLTSNLLSLLWLWNSEGYLKCFTFQKDLNKKNSWTNLEINPWHETQNNSYKIILINVGALSIMTTITVKTRPKRTILFHHRNWKNVFLIIKMSKHFKYFFKEVAILTKFLLSFHQITIKRSSALLKNINHKIPEYTLLV